jgi:hypothetical protein
MRTANEIRYTDDAPETVVTSVGYVDVWPEDDDGASVTVHGVNYRLDEPSPGRGHRKDNGRTRLKRTARACSARGKALKRSGSKVAASRLAKLCPPPGRRRKPNGAARAYVTLDGNMAPATVAKLKKLLDKRVPATFQHADYPNSDVAAVMRRAKIAPASTDAAGRYVYRIPKARMMILLPALLRSRNEADEDLGRSFCEHFDIGIS